MQNVIEWILSHVAVAPEDAAFRITTTVGVLLSFAAAMMLAYFQPVLKRGCLRPLVAVLFFAGMALVRAEYRIIADTGPSWWGFWFWFGLSASLAWFVASIWDCRHDGDDRSLEEELGRIRRERDAAVEAAVARARADWRLDVQEVGEALMERGRREAEFAERLIAGMKEAATTASASTVSALEPTVVEAAERAASTVVERAETVAAVLANHTGEVAENVATVLAEVERAAAAVPGARMQADRAEEEAERARSEADRAEEEADRARGG